MSGQTGRRAYFDVMCFGGAATLMAAALAAFHLTLQFAPHPVFAYSIREGRFTLYSDRPIGEGERRELVEAGRRIGRCEFDDPRFEHEVFLCHDEARFALFAWPQHGALGITNYFGVSFVKADTVRSLASLIAHERTHAMIAWRYGAFASWFIDDWKEEGICEYVSGETSYDVASGKALLRAGGRDDRPGFAYFTYWMAVKHLVESEGMTLTQIIETGRTRAEVLEKAVDAIGRE